MADWFKIATTILDHVPDVVAVIDKLKTENVITDAQALELLKADSQRVVDGATAWLAAHPKAATDPHPPPYVVPQPASPPAKNEEKPNMSTQVVASFKKGNPLRGVMNGSSLGKNHPDSQKKAANSDEIKAGTSTVSVGQFAQFDVTPISPAGDEYTANDPRVDGPEFSKEDGTSPILEVYALKDDGTDIMQQPDNPLNLRAYGKEHNNGCTWALKLERAFGEGRTRLRIGSRVNGGASYNGGVEVVSDPAVVWFD